MAGTFPSVLNQFAPGGTLLLAASTAASTRAGQVGRRAITGIIVTTSGGGTVQIYDTSGTSIVAGTQPLVQIANAAAVGPVAGLPLFGVQTNNGALCVMTASSPAVTIVFS